MQFVDGKSRELYLLADPRNGRGDVIKTVRSQPARVLAICRADPDWIQKRANSKRRIAQGGYGSRQLYDLVQGSADEMWDQDSGTRIRVVAEIHLYCGNQGAPVPYQILPDTISHGEPSMDSTLASYRSAAARQELDGFSDLKESKPIWKDERVDLVTRLRCAVTTDRNWQSWPGSKCSAESAFGEVEE